jgi:hypothetical protein
VLALSESGSWTQQQLAVRYGVTQSAISHALRRHRSATTDTAGPRQQELDLTATATATATAAGAEGDGDAAAGSADGDVPAAKTTGTAPHAPEPVTAAAAGGDVHVGDGPLPDTEGPQDTVGDAGGGSDVAAPAGEGTAAPVTARRIESEQYTCRYAGVMLAHA